MKFIALSLSMSNNLSIIFIIRHLVQIKVCIHVYYFSKIPLKFILLDDVSNESILFCKNRNFDRLPTKKKKGQETHFGSTHSLFSSLF